MSHKYLIIIAGGIFQVPLVEQAISDGYIPIVYDANKNCPGFKNTSVVKRIISIDDIESIVGDARKMSKKHNIVGALTAGTDFSTTVAAINQELGLNGNSYDVALSSKNKILMREKLEKHGIKQPKFFKITSCEEAVKLLHKYKSTIKNWVLKPVDSMGARGVFFIDDSNSEDDINHFMKESEVFTKQDYYILEEYIDSHELSIDALVVNGKVFITGVADRFISKPPYFVEFGHLMYSTLENDLVKVGKEIFFKGIQALGLKTGAAKGDIRVRYENGKPVGYIGEIASRLSGGIMSAYTYPYATGVNLMKNVIEVAVNNRIYDIEHKWEKYSCEMGICANKKGFLRRINNLKNCLEIPNMKSAIITRKAGSRVNIPINNVQKLGHVFSQADSSKRAVEACEEALNKLELVID